ncbi:MAG: hypothetical protein V4570_00030 [Pseudomonadota bacterium]
MIKIHCFNEAFLHYKLNKLSFRLLQEQAAVLLGISENTNLSVSNALEITQEDIDLLQLQPEATQDFNFCLGGYVYICEVELDLLQILGCDFEWAEAHDGNWPNVTDIAMSWDACEFLPESIDDPQWVMFLMCWNNAGGPVYYVPKHLWAQARVIEHIETTNPTPHN